jgi:genome maintenance exonuclease 1
MKINKHFEYTELHRTNIDGRRYYTCPVSGAYIASVTTILDATAYKPELEAWKERVGPKKAKEIKDEAAALGSLMHTHLECHIMRKERPKGNNLVRQMASNMADSVIGRGLAYVDEVWGIETGLYYPGVYAGTTDLVGLYKGYPAIMDYKTTKTMKTRAQIEDYFCQCAAYAMAHNTLYGTDISRLVIFMISRDLKFETFVAEAGDFTDYATRWAERVAAFHDQQQPLAA